jgi:hypothetical protein
MDTTYPGLDRVAAGAGDWYGSLSLTSGSPIALGSSAGTPVWAGLIWHLLGAEVHSGMPVNLLFGHAVSIFRQIGNTPPLPPKGVAGFIHIARRYRQSEDSKFAKQSSVGAGCLLARKPSRVRNATHARSRIRKTARFLLSLMSKASFTMGAVPTVYMGESHANIGCDGAHPISVTSASFVA